MDKKKKTMKKTVKEGEVPPEQQMDKWLFPSRNKTHAIWDGNHPAFAVSWMLDRFRKWSSIKRETFIDQLSLRHEREDEPPELAAVDFFVSTVDPMKEAPLFTANTVVSVLAVDYPVDKVSCYVSADAAALLTFESLVETAEFAIVEICGAHDVVTMNSQGLSMFQERRGLVISITRKLVQKMLWLSAILMNAPFILNLDYDHYINNMMNVFLDGPQVGKDVSYVQFTQRIDGIERSDRNANRNIVFFDLSS
ncbi:hypothetical protein Ancab_005442 [Ancistrocladus abbreviatus]